MLKKITRNETPKKWLKLGPSSWTVLRLNWRKAGVIGGWKGRTKMSTGGPDTLAKQSFHQSCLTHSYNGSTWEVKARCSRSTAKYPIKASLGYMRLCFKKKGKKKVISKKSLWEWVPICQDLILTSSWLSAFIIEVEVDLQNQEPWSQCLPWLTSCVLGQLA